MNISSFEQRHKITHSQKQNGVKSGKFDLRNSQIMLTIEEVKLLLHY